MAEDFLGEGGATPDTFDRIRQRIRERYPGLSPHLQRIARASLEEPNAFALNTTAVIAGQLDIQPSTLIRFAKEFGYAGFSDLQKVFRQRLIEGDAEIRDRVLARTADAEPADLRALSADIIDAHRASLTTLAQSLDITGLGRALDVLQRAPHVYVAGLRRSKPIADYFHYGLVRSERAATILDFVGGMAGPQIATFGPDDVLFAVAFPPYSAPVVDAVLDAHLSGRHVVTVTDTSESPLAKTAEVSLLISPDATSQFQPISSAIALVHILVTALAQR